MSGADLVPFERYAAEQLELQREALTCAWLERISGELCIRPRWALPTDELLDRVPEVLRRVAAFVCSPDERGLTGEAAVVEALSALARLRQRQGHDVQELIHEFDLLARVLDGACLEWLRAYPGTAAPESVARVAGRLNRAPILMGEISVAAFWESEREERARQARGFADMLVHELRNPLGAAEMAALVLERGAGIDSGEEQRRFITLIQRNLRRASVVIGDVRDLAFAEGAEPPGGRVLPVGQVLGTVLAEIREVAMAAGVRIEVEEPVPDLRVDASRLEIILLNLIGNAIKYSDPERGAPWVRLRFGHGSGDDGGWWIEVGDNGLGIPPECHARVFDRFFRAHPDRADGTGLGLAIVREAVRQLGGTIRFDSGPGVGTTFRVSLPAPAGKQEGQ